MPPLLDSDVNTKLRLVTIRHHLAENIRLSPSNAKLVELRVEVDAALDRLASNRYGVCEICGAQIDPRTLQVDPLIRHCFSHLSNDAQMKTLWARRMANKLEAPLDEAIAVPTAILHPRQATSRPAALPKAPAALPKAPAALPKAPAALPKEPATLPKEPAALPKAQIEPQSSRVFRALRAAWRELFGGTDELDERDQDITRAASIHSDLLPASHLQLEPWEVYFVYASAGPLGGDYCDLVPSQEGDFFLFFGDAMGKGIAASLIVSRLHTLFRTLLDLKLPFEEMFDRANRIFCECARGSGYYATLVCCHASATGELELINAGHLPPLLLRRDGTERIMATGMPLGLFYTNNCEVAHIQLSSGETLLFYTDGITEARDSSEKEYGGERLERLVSERKHLGPKELVHTCHADVSAYAATAKLRDDLTLLALRHL